MQTQWLTICKKIIILTILCITALSCDPGTGGETPRHTYKVAIKNESASPVSIYGYRTLSPNGIKLNTAELLTTIAVEPVSLSNISTITLPVQLGHVAFGFIYPEFNETDSVVIKFSNNKGYYSSTNNKDFWIENKPLLKNIKEKDIVQQDGVLIYPITQQDYENAHDLP